MTPKQIAQRIVDALFQDADHLVLEIAKQQDGRGWGKNPARDRIERILRSLSKKRGK